MSEQQNTEEEFYLLGYWVNPYSVSHREYFWSGPFDTRKDALAFGRGKQNRGQPKQFRDWMKGENKVFNSWEKFEKAALKAGFTPRRDW